MYFVSAVVLMKLQITISPTVQFILIQDKLFFRQDRQLFVTSCGKITWLKWAIYHYYCYY